MKNSSDKPGADEGLLGRWARRKSAVRRGDLPVEDRPDAAVEDIEDSAVPAVDSRVERAESESEPATEPAAAADDEVPARPPLPDIESLDESSDYSAFMSPEVDAGLRRAALRRLFHSPGMNITDGLDDYAEDYTSFPALGGMVTADMRFAERRKAELLAREERERELAAAAQEPVESTDVATKPTPDADTDGDADAGQLPEQDQSPSEKERLAQATADEERSPDAPEARSSDEHRVADTDENGERTADEHTATGAAGASPSPPSTGERNSG